ncbi:MAG: anaerobic ribonucleoside-triphosphate reductase activating protein [Firmicutes bacterium]|nr:anaerobic ribonucleoside-triphosphate reductase activating protein [Bacillota bacterium]
MRVFGIERDSIVDGPGIRTVIFCQGCPWQCEGCHNPKSWDFEGGTEYTVEQLVEQVFSNPLLSGVTLSGGEPFCQAGELAQLVQKVKARGLDVWCYSGYTFEQLVDLASKDKDTHQLLQQLDVLVDGPFLIAKKDLNLLFRGSQNQRLIDVQNTLKNGKIVLFDEKNLQW